MPRGCLEYVLTTVIILTGVYLFISPLVSSVAASLNHSAEMVADAQNIAISN